MGRIYENDTLSLSPLCELLIVHDSIRYGCCTDDDMRRLESGIIYPMFIIAFVVLSLNSHLFQTLLAQKIVFAMLTQLVVSDIQPLRCGDDSILTSLTVPS